MAALALDSTCAILWPGGSSAGSAGPATEEAFRPIAGLAIPRPLRSSKRIAPIDGLRPGQAPRNPAPALGLAPPGPVVPATPRFCAPAVRPGQGLSSGPKFRV